MPKTDFTQELHLGLSGGRTANPTTFFLGDQHLLTSAGRDLYVLRTQSFEQGRINGLEAPIDSKKVELSIECQEWMKKNPKAQFQDGKTRQEIELTAAQVGIRHPVLFYLVCRSRGGKGSENWTGAKKEKQVYWSDQSTPIEKTLYDF